MGKNSSPALLTSAPALPPTTGHERWLEGHLSLAAATLWQMRGGDCLNNYVLGNFSLDHRILLTLHHFVYSYLPEYLNIFLSSNSFWPFFRFFCMCREYIIIKRRIQPPFFLFVCFFILSSSSKISRAVFNKSNECNHLYLILHLRENYFNTSSCCLMLAVSFSYTA